MILLKRMQRSLIIPWHLHYNFVILASVSLLKQDNLAVSSFVPSVIIWNLGVYVEFHQQSFTPSGPVTAVLTGFCMKTVPADLQQISRRGDEQNKLPLNKLTTCFFYIFIWPVSMMLGCFSKSWRLASQRSNRCTQEWTKENKKKSEKYYFYIKVYSDKRAILYNSIILYTYDRYDILVFLSFLKQWIKKKHRKPKMNVWKLKMVYPSGIGACRRI